MIRNIATSQGHDYATGYLIDYPYFQKYFTTERSKQQVLNAYPKAVTTA